VLESSKGPGAIVMVIVMFSLAMSSCSPPSSGTLTSADIPSYLGVTRDSAFSTSYARQVAAPPRCRQEGLIAFSAPKRRVASGSQESEAGSDLRILSAEFSCTNVTEAHNAVESGALISAPNLESVPGIGDEAVIESIVSPKAREYSIAWRKSTTIGLLLIFSAGTEQKMAEALAESLAERLAGRA